jgi:hypothetical protein
MAGIAPLPAELHDRFPIVIELSILLVLTRYLTGCPFDWHCAQTRQTPTHSLLAHREFGAQPKAAPAGSKS